MTIAVLGSANMDLVVHSGRRPRPGETIFGTSFTTGPGGKGLNQAAAAARAGGDVVLLAAVGDDAFGADLRRVIAREGIDAAGLRTVPGPTGTAHISVTDDGENTIVVVPGANAAATLDDADRARIAAATHLVIQLERPLPLVLAALAHARDAGVTTVVTPAPVAPGLAELVALADILVPNAGEACTLAGLDDPEAAAIALSRTAPAEGRDAAGTVIVTLGSAGAVVARGGEIVQRVAPRAVAAVDTTAAGDTFVGVLVAHLAESVELDAALDAATAAASITVTRPGAVESMPVRAEIDAVLAAG